MKGALFICMLVAGVRAEAPAPYPASGWRPNGPAFELPQKQSAQYLPPVDPRNPSPGPTASPDQDVSVQGLPAQEQQPVFQTSPISGQQYAGPNFNNDLKYQQQQQRYREYQRQKELEVAQARANGNRVTPQVPRQFARTTTEAPTTPVSTTELDLNQEEVLNEPEQAKDDKVSVEVTKQKVQEYPGELFLSSLAQLQLQPQFVPLQVSNAYLQPQNQKQVAGFDGRTHLAALPSVLAQQQNQGYQPFIVQSEPVVVPPVAQYQPSYQPQIPAQQPEGVILQAPAQFQPNVYVQPNRNPSAVQGQYEPQNYQPNVQAYPQLQAQPVLIPQNYAPQPENSENQNQFYQQPIMVQPQSSQINSQNQVPQNQYLQPQYLAPQQQYSQTQNSQPELLTSQEQQNSQAPQGLQPQYLAPQYLAPQQQYSQTPQKLQPELLTSQEQQYSQAAPQGLQPQYLAPQQYSQTPQNLQPQFVNPQEQQYSQVAPQNLQPQYLAPQTTQPQYITPQYLTPQGQGSLQSGLDLNQEGNDIEQNPEEDNEEDSATAVATAFGTRTQPRVNTRYGAPFPVPKVQANPDYATTTESTVEDVNDDGAQAHAVAVANGERRKSARLRARRIRPVLGVDRSGRLVLAEV